MRIVGLGFGIVAILLGGLWLVQGLGLVTIKPIACVANCETLQGPSTLWAVVGFALLVVGAFTLFRTLTRKRSAT